MFAKKECCSQPLNFLSSDNYLKTPKRINAPPINPLRLNIFLNNKKSNIIM